MFVTHGYRQKYTHRAHKQVFPCSASVWLYTGSKLRNRMARLPFNIVHKENLLTPIPASKILLLSIFA